MSTGGREGSRRNRVASDALSRQRPSVTLPHLPSVLKSLSPDVRGWRPTFHQQVLAETRGRKFLVLVAIYGFAAVAGGYGASSGSPERWDPTDPSVDLFILSLITTFFAGLLGVAASFDTFFRERMNGTFDTMLVRPATREGLYLGKSLAQFLPYYLVMAVFNDLGVLVIGRNVGYPGPLQVAVFVLVTPLVMLIFVLLLNGISFVRPSSFSLICGLILWLFFSPFVWPLIPASIGAAAGYDVSGTAQADIRSDINVLSNWVDMSNPMFASIGTVAVTGNDASYEWVYGIPACLPFVSITLWLALALVVGTRCVRSYGMNRPGFRRHVLRWLPHMGQ
ncbi:MAG TPA: hypothetical protein EYP43_02810 [Thermoplasmata archaeon]|nr:hypothetical protein [Thermoplasmata archaeon]